MEWTNPNTRVTHTSLSVAMINEWARDNRLPLWMHETTQPEDAMRWFAITRNFWWHKMRLNHRLITMLFGSKTEFSALDKRLWRFFWGGWFMLGAKDN